MHSAEGDGDRTTVADFSVQPDVAPLYLKHEKAMRGSARKAFGAGTVESDVDEAISRVFATLQEAHAAGRLRDKDDWKSYMRASARNAAYAIARERARERERVDSLDARREANNGEDQTLGSDDPLDPVGDEVIKNADVRDVRAAIAHAGFSDQQMYVLHASFARGMNDKQIGDWLGVSGQAVGKMRRRAQTKLGELLDGR